MLDQGSSRAKTGSPGGVARAARRHLQEIDGIHGCSIFLRTGGESWIEAARVGTAPLADPGPVLQATEPDSGGTVRPRGEAEEQDGWLATYACVGPEVELVLIAGFKPIDPGPLQARLEKLEAKAGWLLVAALRERSQQKGDIAQGLEMGGAILQEAPSARNRLQLAHQWIARLERAFQPGLVAVCRVPVATPSLLALSGGAVVDRNSAQRTALEALAAAAMELRAVRIHVAEAGQDTDPDTAQLDDALERLGAGACMLLPLYDGDNCRSVVIVLWNDAITPLPDMAAAELIGSILESAMSIQQRAHPSLLRRAGTWLADTAAALFGRRGLKLKVALLVAVLVLVAASQIPSSVAPAFNATVEARDRRIVSAPFDGFVAEAPFELGDTVPAGDVIVAMEDTDLRLELAQAQAEQARLETEIQAARADRDTARLRELAAQLEQVDVRVELLEYQREQTRQVVDTETVVIGGDAWERVGGRVRLGEPLLEVAEPGSFAVRARIDEGWVADLPDGASGQLLLSAFPETPIPVRLERVTSQSSMEEGVNVFTSWMTLEDGGGEVALRDGMRGIVRVDAGESTLLAEYTRGLRRWFSTRLWALQ
ncbi:efflux RND transporter periplasmic adaptor subunit [Histidinibacterium aquaticum]|uniref:Biotin/lipoyl-binding protein n=1 Tax=Histidinibacterium aquaticum TaxID=2613962 RepID=A0A5J5GMK5_9RHOB|nr:efflux RND transporter periplasmic adaptor subunit [Histidinibacterium aquaticum]KAA9009469.1 biotin/lipoyl-binding protein [Histidinibacterium aquaticum]